MIRKSLFAAVVLVLIGAFGASAGGLPQATYIPPFDNVATHFLNGQGGFTIPTSAAGAYAGAYQVNNAGVLGGGNIHHSAGVSTWQVDDAGHVIAATFHQTGQYVEWWTPSGETQYWSRNGTQSWHYDDPAGVTSVATDNSGVTLYHPTGDVRYGTYQLNGVDIPAGGYEGAYQVNTAGFLAGANIHESATSFWAVNTAGIVIAEWPKSGDTVYVVYDPVTAGVTEFTVKTSGFETRSWLHGAYNLPDNAVPATAVSLYNANLIQSWSRSGVSLTAQGNTNNDGDILYVASADSGTSFVPQAHNSTIVLSRNNSVAGTYQRFGLPSISGVSEFFFDIEIAGTAGGYIIEAADVGGTDAHASGAPDMIVWAGGARQGSGAGDGVVTGFVIPPNTSYERYLIKGYRADTASGVSNIYKVEATSASGVSILNLGPGW